MTEKKERKPAAAARFLDQRFRITERGSSVKQEVLAGMGAFLVAVCALLMNTQIIGTYYGNYAGAYLAVSLVTFLGTLALGFACNLPLIMTANMSLSTVMISLMASNSGITYANLLAVTFLAAAVYLAVVLTPAKKVLVDALPAGVRKALPAGMGLYVIYTALKNTGILTEAGTMASAADYSDLNQFYFWLMIAGIVLLGIYTAFGRKNALGSTYLMLIGAMWVCGIVFYLEYFIGGQTATTLVYQRLNLIAATDGASPYNLLNGFASLQPGELFREGFNFSAYTEAGGNAALFILESVLTFLFLGMYTNLGCADGAMEAGELPALSAAEEKKMLAAGAAANLLSAAAGGTPISVAPQSAMGTSDGGRTGLASVAAGIGFLIAVCNWIFFALTATSTNGVGMWINDTETKLAAYVQDGFLFADLVMIFVGAAMLKSIRKLNVKDHGDFIPFLTTLIGMAFFDNFVVGIALGALLSIVIRLGSSERKSITVPQIVLVALLLLTAFLSLQYGGNFVTAVQTMGGPPM